jgi:hypothetical protein
MTRRRNPPPRRPLGPGRPSGKEKEQNVDNELRLARAVRKAESLQKQRLRRGDWDADYDEAGEPAEVESDAMEGTLADGDDFEDDGGDDDREE